MSNRLYPFDESRLKSLFENFTGEPFRAELEKYIREEILPKIPNPKTGARGNALNPALRAAIEYGRRHGLLKPGHLVMSSALDAWNEEQKKRFRELYESGASYRAIAEDPLLKDAIADFKSRTTAVSNAAERLRCDKAKRRQAKRTTHEAKKIDSVWGLPGFKERVHAIVLSGALVDSGPDALFELLRKEFAETAKTYHLTFSKSAFKKRLYELLWPPDVDKALQEVIRARMDPKKEFCPLFPHIPESMVERRARWHRGVITTSKRSGRAVPGIFRVPARAEFGDLSKFRMPQTSFRKPCEIAFADDKNDWTLMFLNGANIGTQYPADIVGNPVRRALSDAEFRGDRVVFATNILAMELKKAAGPRKVGRALVMGDNINTKIFADEEYRREVEDIIANAPEDEVAYQNAEELLDNLLAGWRKICVKPNKKPEFTRSIFVILGYNEEEIIKTIAYWDVHYWTQLKQNELSAKIKVTSLALAAAERNDDWTRFAENERRLEILQERLNRTRVTNVATQEWQRFYNRARALVVRKIERAIPNAKVIGQGTTLVKIDGEIIEINIPHHDRVTDALLKNYAGNYGPRNLREMLAKTVVICGPWGIQFRGTVREADYDGKRGSAKIFVAPIDVDDAYLREILADTVKSEHPLARAMSNDQFFPGVLRLSRANGVIDADFVPVKALEAHKKYPKPRRQNRDSVRHFSPYAQGTKYIWIEIPSDPHWGGRSKEFVTDKASGKRLGMGEAVFEMQRREGLCVGTAMPVHIVAVCDDPSQGQNFPARTQPHPHELSPQRIEELSLALMKHADRIQDPQEFREILRSMNRFYSYQIETRAADFPHHQMFQMIERQIMPNADIWSAVLRRARHAGLVVRGLSAFPEAREAYALAREDTRDVGILNFGSGNHMEHTVNGEIIEGPFYAFILRLLLGKQDEWHGEEEFLRRMVAAPHYSGKAIGWGRFRVGNGYEYGLEVRDSPPRMSGWGDPIYGAVKNDPQRGNYSRIFNGRMAVKIYGDKHFFGTAATDYALYHMSASGTHTDRYGEYGFPPNNTGVSFVGLPVDGPDSGPILIRYLPFDVIKDFVEDNPRPFDWEKYLQNPA
ncbi:MAG: hypothetical protein HYS74_00540 [Parcubacteria group bacterium]|nr:hypothetical protein [Parcubacteria group bacterium]